MWLLWQVLTQAKIMLSMTSMVSQDRRFIRPRILLAAGRAAVRTRFLPTVFVSQIIGTSSLVVSMVVQLCHAANWILGVGMESEIAMIYQLLHLPRMAKERGERGKEKVKVTGEPGGGSGHEEFHIDLFPRLPVLNQALCLFPSIT